MIIRFLKTLIISYFTTEKQVNYKLAVQKWCSDKYLIHGLWIDYNKGGYPEYCSNKSFVLPTGALMENMMNKWYNCDDESTNNLWKHEWEKHGTCFLKYSSKINNEEEYFGKTLELFDEYQNTIYCPRNSKSCIFACFDKNFNVIECQ